MRLFHFNEYVTTGNPIDLKNVSNSIVLGKALAEKLLANIGDVVQLTTSQGERFPLKVVGYFESGLLDFDKTQAYASIGTVQKLLGKDKSYVTDLQVIPPEHPRPTEPREPLARAGIARPLSPEKDRP